MIRAYKDTMHPDFTKPYFIVFGTSHTAGACQNGDSKWLEYHEKWASKLEAHLGMPVYNLSRQGTINQRITQILNDVVDEWDLSKCKGIIIECRLQNHGSAVSLSAFNDYKHFPIQTKDHLNRDLYSTMMYGDNDYAFNRFFSVYAGGKVRKPGYSKGLLYNAFQDKDLIPDQAVKDLDNYLEQRSNFYHRTDHQFWDDVNEIRNWRTMCKLAGIPFKWFNWSKVAVDGMLVDWMVNEYSNVFDDNLLGVTERRLKSAWEHIVDLGYKNDDPEIHCECKHLNALGNEITWQILKPRIDEWLKNK